MNMNSPSEIDYVDVFYNGGGIGWTYVPYDWMANQVGDAGYAWRQKDAIQEALDYYPGISVRVFKMDGNFKKVYCQEILD